MEHDGQKDDDELARSWSFVFRY